MPPTAFAANDAPATPWIEPAITDRQAILARHPECALDGARLAAYEPAIRRRAQALDATRDPEAQEEIRSRLRTRLIELGTAYRQTDIETGEPIYDYYDQATNYVVLHASGEASSWLRRERLHESDRVSIEVIGPRDRESGEATQTADLHDATQDDVGQRDLEFRELVDEISADLRPAQLRVFVALSEGYAAADLPDLLGISRKTVYSHLEVIRTVTEQALARVAEPSGIGPARRRREHVERRAAARQVSIDAERRTGIDRRANLAA
jgi:hypothetical protein